MRGHYAARRFRQVSRSQDRRYFGCYASSMLAALAIALAAETLTLSIGGGDIEMLVEREQGDRPARADIERWLDRAAGAVTAFYGRFPVPRVRIRVAVDEGSGLDATTFQGRFIRMRLGRDTPLAQLDRDWTLTHELFHLAFPSHDLEHRWMQEGLSTYYEPIARARVGDLAPEVLWKELCGGLPKGVARDARVGLDERGTWGATYWGGALFWLVLDVTIRERTAGRHSADDGLRAILAAGGDGRVDWPLERILETGDRATETKAFSELYHAMGQTPYAADLPALERRLGVECRGDDSPRFHDDAPLAAVRRAITSRESNPGAAAAPRRERGR
jgi:hypothetical protein